MTDLPSILLVLQAVAALLLLKRLMPGRRRNPAVDPSWRPSPGASVSILVPTLDEARRIEPLIRGVIEQGELVREVIFVDSGSTDGTTARIAEAAARDARVRLERDPPLPAGWIGKAWALQHGAVLASGPWLLGLDADVAPHPRLAAAAVAAAEKYQLDAVSFAPRFAGQTALERWIQPAILTTLVYRFGPAGTNTRPEDTMANGQCFLVRKDLLLEHGGYEPVRRSFAEDVSLARHLASRGVRVGFLDGRLLYDVRSYDSAGQMWREWGRSVDLKDATSGPRQLIDVIVLVLVQGLPLPLLLAIGAGLLEASGWLLGLNLALLLIRFLLTAAMAPSYAERGISFWLSPLADPLAVLRVILSTLRRPKSWRTRSY